VVGPAARLLRLLQRQARPLRKPLWCKQHTPSGNHGGSPHRLPRPAYTVERGSPSRHASWWGPSLYRARAARMRASTCGSSRRGERCGRQERSASPASPSARQRRSHAYAHERDTPCISAARATGYPSLVMRSISSLRPCTVSLPLGLVTRASLPRCSTLRSLEALTMCTIYVGTTPSAWAERKIRLNSQPHPHSSSRSGLLVRPPAAEVPP
jgi:hypothetical protein